MAKFSYITEEDKPENLGLVVQSIVSLTKSLVMHSLNLFSTRKKKNC